jgi:hypothetical protein
MYDTLTLSSSFSPMSIEAIYLLTSHKSLSPTLVPI